MKLIFCGGASEVGSSCIYLRINGKGIVLDSGIRQSAGKDPLPDFRSIQEAGGADAIIISHAHMDHIGSLPVLSQAYPAARIYMTPMTMNLAKVLLYDSLKIMGRKEEEIPIYNEDAVISMFRRVVPVQFQSEYTLFDHFSFTFYPAGHIAGAACTFLSTPEGTIFYTGDVSSFAQKTIDGLRIPRLRPDVMITESTYGDRLHASRQAEELRLINAVREHAEAGHKVLIPSFALGRAQEVLLILRQAIVNKQIPDVPVYVDGMVRDINRVYTQHPAYLRSSLANRILKGNEPFYTDNIKEVLPADDRELLTEQKGPCIFVASSGMLTGGPSMLYAKKLAQRDDACIILTGYQDEESPGRALLNLLEDENEKSITLDGMSIAVRCPVMQVGLSAHADKSELSAAADRLQPRHIFIVHGEENAASALAEELSSDFRRMVYQPYCAQEISIVIRNKRRQLDININESMYSSDPVSEDNVSELRYFCMKQYPKRSMTLEQLYYVYSGNRIRMQDITEEESQKLEQFQKIILGSGMFVRDFRRMYLFMTADDETLKQFRNKSRNEGFLTMQETEAVLKQITDTVSVRKFGYDQNRHTVILNMDFPDTLSQKQVEEIGQKLKEKTGWSLRISPAVNHQAVRFLLKRLFPGIVTKISYFEYSKTYSISASASASQYAEQIEEFKALTGWNLLFNGEGTAAAKKKELTVSLYTDDWFFPVCEGEIMEQNALFALIDSIFADSPVRPYKKSIKNDQRGKYYELVFITPQMGRRTSELIQKAANMSHARMHISQSFNQQELLSAAYSVCSKYGIALKKNPSWHASEQAVKIDADGTISEEMKKEFTELTGVSLKKKI